MEDEVVRPKQARRTLLQRALMLLGGGVGLAAGAREVRAEAVAPAAEPLRLVVRRRPAAPAGTGAGSHMTCSGELLDADGTCLGTFRAHALCLGTAFGAALPSAANLEFQSFELPEGTLFGLAAGSAADGARSCAVLGGVGRFAAARGTYSEQALPGQAGRDAVSVVFELKA